MNRATDPNSPEPSAEDRAAIVLLVCPFCGTVSETPGVACRQCGMENSQATRAATRSKIGPWYVWQARNPSAPGMNWATLISLIERGRVTPRSIVRGPTTGQLWRFAARVKGVSREFGACWHCGSDIQRNARLCPACKRLQQTPTNPDALLETDLYVAPSAPRPQIERSVAPQPTEVAPPPPPRPQMPQDGQPLPMATEPARRLPRGPVPIVDVGGDVDPGGLDMRAFDLADDYDDAPRRGGGVFRKMLVAAVIAVLCGVAAGGYSPPFRDAVVKGYYAVVARVTGRAQQPATQPAPTLTPIPSSPGESITASHRQTPTTHATLPSAPRPAKPPEVSVGPGPKASEKARKASTTKPQVVATAPVEALVPIDPKTTDRWAWERLDQASKAEQKFDYAQAVRDYQWIIGLRLPDGIGPQDVQARLDRAKGLLMQQQLEGGGDGR